MPHYSKKWLLSLLALGSVVDYLFFWGHANPKNEAAGKFLLSQWYPLPFEWEGNRYATAEHWMMAGKARLFGDTAMLEQILAAPSPKEAKALGRKVRGFEPDTWNAQCFELVVQGNVHKFGQHPAAMAYLLGTGNKVIVEASPSDAIWGIGHAQGSSEAADPAKWRGQNLLGFALMEARDRLRAHTRS
ncbi:NADAR family protein [Flaviaesturariibacter amylovorans]|uniref:NADAR domain-containing protein n=1 Tax=Flaviaesturariibacter amylovorans TaxID=1084520 RepID=A0ABP8GWD7_9BACT